MSKIAMRFSASLLCLLCCALSTVFAQKSAILQPEQYRLGIMTGIGMNVHSASFSTLSNLNTCCDKFTGGTGWGIVGGISAEIPIYKRLYAGLGIVYADQSGLLGENQIFPVIIAGGPVDAQAAHKLQASVQSLMIEPMAGIRLGRLSIFGGLSAGMLFNPRFEYFEELVQPALSGTFSNGLRIRNEQQGALPDKQFQIGILAGMRLAIPLGRSGNWMAEPGITLRAALNSLTSQTDWSAHSIRLGVQLSYIGRSEIAPLINDTVQPVLPQPIVNPKKQIAIEKKAENPAQQQSMATLRAEVYQADGKKAEAAIIKNEEFIGRELMPLLPYIFFEKNESILSDRYTKRNRSKITIAEIARNGIMPLYHDILNIIALRMQQYPQSRLQIQGCSLQDEDANIARQRAETIKAYLNERWNINPARIEISGRGLPQRASNMQTPYGIAENRRAELSSNDPRLLAPVFVYDTLHVISPPIIRFSIDSSKWKSLPDQKGWQIKLSADENQVKNIQCRAGIIPEWDMAMNGAQLAGAQYIHAVLSPAGGIADTQISMASIPIEHTTISKKRKDKVQDKEIERFQLMLFDFDKADINEQQQRILDSVQADTDDGTKITIIGSTDIYGDEQRNKQLSLDRARVVAGFLKQKNNVEIRGEGMKELYDNALPEGRFYCRTVRIVLEKPIKEK